MAAVIHNKLYVQGRKMDVAEIAIRLGSTVSKPGLQPGEYEVTNEPFSLWNIVAPSEAIYPAYSVGNFTTRNWNNSNWGTPGDAINPRVLIQGDVTWMVRFDTPLCEPDKAIEELGRQYPDTDVTSKFYHKDGSGRAISRTRGPSREMYSWGPTVSHKQYEDFKGGTSCPCNHMTNPLAKFPFYDCIRPPIPTKQAVHEFDQSSSLV